MTLLNNMVPFPEEAPHGHMSIASIIGSNEPTDDSRHRTFIYRNGCKLHSFTFEEAPWPFSFNREVLEQCALDHAMIVKITDSQSFMDFKGWKPTRCLDLGTAMGDWVIDTAKRFQDCTFVGFDLVDIQIPLQVLEPSIARRIEWVHGNFLTHRLPFNANEFDYIHLEGVALGVPEDKWHWLFGELHRVLRPGGYIELLQQDALFPVLPRWFTDPLHAHLEQRAPILPGRSRQAALPRVSDKLPHVHALLEELFYSVFDSRFINPTPSSILPDFFTTTFRHVVSPPILRFPMPPIPPLIPRLDESLLPSPTSAPGITNDPTNPFTEFIPAPEANAPSALSSSTTLVDSASTRSISSRARPRSRSASPRPSTESSATAASSHTIQLERTSTLTFDDEPSAYFDPEKRHSVATLVTSETTTIGDARASAMFRVERMQALPSDNLFMHLYQAVQMVLAMKEAMWDELVKRVEARDPALVLYGWESGDYEINASRERFDALLERYRGDMQVRMSLWHSLVKAGWSYPRREPLTTVELDEEEKLRQAILDARKNAREEDFTAPTRSIRLLLGVKDDSYSG